jgi:hypothetical protein
MDMNLELDLEMEMGKEMNVETDMDMDEIFYNVYRIAPILGLFQYRKKFNFDSVS